MQYILYGLVLAIVYILLEEDETAKYLVSGFVVGMVSIIVFRLFKGE